MKTVSGTLWFAARVSWSRRSGNMSASAVFALGSVLVTFLALASLAVPRVAKAQEERRHAITPRVDEVSDSPSRPGGLLVFDPHFRGGQTRWQGHEINRGYYAGGTSGSAIPGVGQPPVADSYVASPSLRRLIDRDPVVGALFDELRPVGTISRDGLVQPGELRAVIGVSPSLELLVPVDGFGSEPPVREDNTILNGSVAIMVVAMVVLPAAAFVAIVSRLRARQRARRIRSLRLMGLSAAATRLVLGVETALVVLPASVFGCLLFNALVQRVTSIPGTSFGFFSEDATVGLVTQALVIVVITSVSAAATALSPRRRTSPTGSRLSGRLAEKVGITVMAVGLVYLVALPMLTMLFGVKAAYGIWVGCAAVAVGLALTGPRIVDEVCRSFARRARAAGTLVGVRMASMLTTTSTRLGSLASVVIVLMLGGISFMSILNGGTYSRWEDVLATHRQVPVVVTDLAGGLGRKDVLGIHPTGGIAQTRSQRVGRHDIDIVYSSCDDLKDLTGTSPENCNGQPQWINSSPRLAAEGPADIDLPGQDPFPAPEPTQVTTLRGWPTYLDASLLLSPTLAPESNPVTFLLVDNDKLSRTLARLSSRSPAIQFDIGALQRANPDFRPFSAQLEWLRFAAILSLLVASLALVASTLGEAPERASRLRGLRVLGAPSTEVVRAHVWATALPIATLGCGASFIGWEVTRAMRTFDDRASVPTEAAVLSALGSIMVALMISLATAPDSLRPTRRSGGVDA